MRAYVYDNPPKYGYKNAAGKTRLDTEIPKPYPQ